LGLELAAVVLERQPLERAHHAEAGIRHQHVEPAQLGDGAGHRPLNIAIPGDVAREHERTSAHRAELSGEGLEPILTPSGQRDIGPLPGEFAGQSGADAG
jgi:hypothetical protein